MKLRLLMPSAWLLVAGCSETGQNRATVELSVAGTDNSEPTEAAGEVLVTLDRADLAFGPLYLCAGTTAGDLCETAKLEWLDTIVVNTLNPAPASAGELTGITGPVRSWMYDLAISSQLTRSEPFVLDAAQDLGDSSFVLEGRAQVGEVSLPFSATIAIQQSEDTELGVPVIRKGASSPFFRDVAEEGESLLMRFDPGAWIQGMDFRPFVGSETCAEVDSPIACDGTVETICGENGEDIEQRDCADSSEVCIPEQGCTERLIIEPDTEAFRSLRNALLVGGRPTFEWTDEETP